MLRGVIIIICRTPYRVSFFGGGTDYPSWYREHGGGVLSTTIDKYCYLMVRHLPPFFEHRFAIRYSLIETCNEVEQIRHPSVRAALGHLRIDRGLEINHDGDLPARSGMGSSSAFTVGLLNALHALGGRMPTKRQLALEAIELEQSVIRETVGSQDQVATAFGGFNRISFAQDGAIDVRPMTIRPERRQRLRDHLMLVYTGIRRTASDVAQSFVPRLSERRHQLLRSQEMVNEAVEILCGSGALADFGRLLHEAWMHKRSLSPLVSNPEVDAMYAAARQAGALGGKLVGAGGGGFLLLFAPPSRHAAIRSRLADRLQVPIDFETTGSQIIFSDTERDYAEQEATRGWRPSRMLSAFPHPHVLPEISAAVPRQAAP